MRRALVVLTVLALLSPLALGDTLYLKNGGKFEGKVVSEDATSVRFKIRGMGEQTFKRSDIDRIEKSESVFDLYEAKRKALAADDAEGWHQLGLWCEENNMRREAKKAYEAAIEADPDHAGAREKTGFVQFKGEWLTKAEHEKVVAEIREREGAVIGGLALGETHRDSQVLLSVKGPKDWKKEDAPGSVTFTGPDLGEVPVVIALDVSDLEDDLSEFVESVTKTLKRIHEDLEALGEPGTAMLLGRAGRLLRFRFTEEGAAKERAEMLVVGAEGGVRLSLVCADGYYDMLRPFFEKVAGSVARMDTPADFNSDAGGFALTYPDDTYEAQEQLMVQIQGVPLRKPDGSAIITCKTNPTASFIVLPGKAGDGRADATSLETLKTSIPKVFIWPNPPMAVQVAESTRKVAISGQEGLAGESAVVLQLDAQRSGKFASCHWAVVKKGDRYFHCFFLNIADRMGAGYARTDFDKFLSGMKILD